jgi:DNA-binding XRE family transcriptional regulator
MASSWLVRDVETFIAYPKLPCKLFFAVHETFFLQGVLIHAKDKTMKVNGEKIKEFREGLGWTVSDFAGKAKVTRQAVEAWEKDGVKAFRTLTKVAKILGVPPALLIDKGNGD